MGHIPASSLARLLNAPAVAGLAVRLHWGWGRNIGTKATGHHCPLHHAFLVAEVQTFRERPCEHGACWRGRARGGDEGSGPTHGGSQARVGRWVGKHGVPTNGDIQGLAQVRRHWCQGEGPQRLAMAHGSGVWVKSCDGPAREMPHARRGCQDKRPRGSDRFRDLGSTVKLADWCARPGKMGRLARAGRFRCCRYRRCRYRRRRCRRRRCCCRRDRGDRAPHLGLAVCSGCQCRWRGSTSKLRCPLSWRQ
jgi:hypothetical protein